ncbi:hypothetical protein E1267_09450 [Nonomuraea longispora]|uniref:SRPBCC family protein n=1 Tax=Nonomuraea longispora TaxID=1848320 RepID=A0A4R4NJH6_9ACTN|nr:hypothetical protein E1267_09450 [Nonomuraea longispora]
MQLYIEARIRTELDLLWHRTQDPAQHRRWDLRFTHIDHLASAGSEPQRFRYAVRLLPGLLISGTGIAAGEKRRPDGTRTSALRFASPHPLSPIARGRGYWRYLPTGDGIRFLTGYDYEPRWGRPGRIADRLVLRPLMGWATAWSFDRLRLWCERGITPERSLRHALADVAARALAIGVAAAVAPVAAVPVAIAALLLPPSHVTPAARRCLRRPTEHTAATPPALLHSVRWS